MLTDSSIRYQVSIKGRVEEGQEEQLHFSEHFHLWQRLGMDVKEKAGEFRHDAIISEFAAKNILGVHCVFPVRLDWNATSCNSREVRIASDQKLQK